MERLRLGWRLAGQSWGVLRSDRTLAAFPVLSGAAVLFLAAAFWIPTALLFRDGTSIPGVLVGALGLYATTFAAVYFSVALTHGAAQVLDGGDATVAGCLAAANARIPQIAGWAGVLASINIVVQALEQQVQGIGRLLLSGLSVAWSLATFMAIPVITLEGTGPWESVQRSAGLFRDRWGEQVSGQASIGFAVFLVVFLPAVLLIVLGVWMASAATAAIGIPVVALGVALLLIGAVVSTCLSRIFAVALYRFAVRGEAGGPFRESTLAQAVGARRRRGFAG